MKIYVASSWRTFKHRPVVEALRAAGHDVYDYRQQGFSWNALGVAREPHSLEAMYSAVYMETCTERFVEDMAQLDAADAVVLVLPSNRSAHLELGYAVGRHKVTGVVWDATEPELMYRMVDFIVDNLTDLVKSLTIHVPPWTVSHRE